MTATLSDTLELRIRRLKETFQQFENSYAGDDKDRLLAWVYHLQELQNQENDTPTLSWAAAAMSLIQQDGGKAEWLIARQCFEARDMLAAYQKISNISQDDLDKRKAYTSNSVDSLIQVPRAFFQSTINLASIYQSASASSVYNHVEEINKDMKQYESLNPYDENVLDALIQRTWLLGKINAELKDKGHQVISLRDLKIADFSNKTAYLTKMRELVITKLGTGGDVNAFMTKILGPNHTVWPKDISNKKEKNEATIEYFRQAYSCNGFDFDPSKVPLDRSSLVKNMREAATKQLQEVAKQKYTESEGKSLIDHLYPYLPPQPILSEILAKETARKDVFSSLNSSSSYVTLAKALTNHQASYPCLVLPPDYTLQASQTHSGAVVSGAVLGVQQQTSRVLVTKDLELHSITDGKTFKIKQDQDKISYFSDIPLQATTISATATTLPHPDEKRGLMYAMIETALINWKEGEPFSIMARNEDELREMLVILHECVDNFKQYDAKLLSFPLTHVEVPFSLTRIKVEVLDYYAEANLTKVRKNPERAPANLQATFSYLATKPQGHQSDLQRKFDLTSEAIRIKLLASLDKAKQISPEWMKDNADDLSKVPYFKAKLQKLAQKPKGMFSRESEQQKCFEEAKAILHANTKSKS